MRRLLASGCVGYIVTFWSELVFGSPQTFDGIAEPVFIWGLYSVAAYALLCVLAVFRVCNLPGLFLAAGLFGWLVEGVLGQEAYDALPMSLSFTGLSWHALISVGLGWYGVTRLLQQRSRLPLAILCIGLGLFWGFWAVSWWSPDEPQRHVTPLRDFAASAALSGALLVAAHWLFQRLQPTRFEPSRIELQTLIGATALFFVAVTVPATPVAAAILPALVAGVIYLLVRHRRCPAGPTLLTQLERPARASGFLILLLIPAAATLFYATAQINGWLWPTSLVVYWITAPLGFVLLIASAASLWRATRPVPATRTGPLLPPLGSLKWPRPTRRLGA